MKCVLTVLFPLLLYTTAFGQSNEEVLASIKQEAKHASIMKSISYLSDVYGPRLMGTPNYYKSVQWIKRELESWGIENIQLQSFDNQYIGWDTEGFKVEMTAPSYAHINAYPLAFSSSTKGDVEGEVMLISSFDEIYQFKGQLKGKIVLYQGYYRPARNVERIMSTRLTDEILTKAKANPDPNDVIVGYHSRRSSKQILNIRARIKRVRAEFFAFCKKEGVLALIEPSDFPYGILHADGNRLLPSYTSKDDIRPIASFVISNEHFGRLVRLKDLGYAVKMKVNLKAKTYDDPKFNVNLIADIEGSDPILKDQLVVIGAHLDSWHAGTGAVDNASNCAVMMEVMRLIKASGLKPRRTIRLVLWGGEEQVFAGSSKYVNDRVGDFETFKHKYEHDKISAYLNLDNGAGKIRGIFLMGNQAIEPYLAEYLQPFPASNTLTIQNANQTDHELFDFFNVPAFQFIQDPLDYRTAIHHTNMDVYEYVPEKDQLCNAQVIAYLAYQLAQADRIMPRKPFNSPIPSKRGNVVFRLEGFENAESVSLVGDFNQWNMFGTPLYKTDIGWETKIDLPPGKYYYKYIVDGMWTTDPETPQKELAKDGKGHGGLTILRVE
ncbi:MAG: M20/M25/M40 family metallo-hydrolase [Bacteroidota bacterium]